MGPGVVAVVFLDERQAAQDPAAGLVGVLIGVDAGGKRGDADLRHVEVAALQGGEPVLVLREYLFDGCELLLKNGELTVGHSVQSTNGDDVLPGEGDHDVQAGGA
jgi:hypothetical protein